MLVAFGFMEYKLLHGITSFRSGHAAFFSSTLRITISLVSLIHTRLLNRMCLSNLKFPSARSINCERSKFIFWALAIKRFAI